MGVLTNLASAQVKKGVRLLYGEVLTRPTLLVTDGISATYCCDVNIGPVDPTGRIRQYLNEKNDEDDNLLTNLPGQPEFELDDTLTVNTILRNVAIARGNADLIYADVGNPVELRRSEFGNWEITGFSRERPGTYTLTPVNIPPLLFGTLSSTGLIVPQPITIEPSEDLSLTTRKLTLEELGTFAPFGQLPLGATAIFIGNTLLRIV